MTNENMKKAKELITHLLEREHKRLMSGNWMWPIKDKDEWFKDWACEHNEIDTLLVEEFGECGSWNGVEASKKPTANQWEKLDEFFYNYVRDNFSDVVEYANTHLITK